MDSICYVVLLAEVSTSKPATCILQFDLYLFGRYISPACCGQRSKRPLPRRQPKAAEDTYRKDFDMPKQYEAMRDKFKKEGMSDREAKAKAAKIYNSKHKKHPVTRGSK